MPCSTMRRHLAQLVRSGFLTRRDSANGKRYSRQEDGEKVAYGFDLTPLAARFGEIVEAAEKIRAVEQRHRRLRERVSLMRRDLAGLACYGSDVRPGLALWDVMTKLAATTARALRRKLDPDALATLEAELDKALTTARNVLEPAGTEDSSTNDVRNEQHIQSSNEEAYVS